MTNIFHATTLGTGTLSFTNATGSGSYQITVTNTQNDLSSIKVRTATDGLGTEITSLGLTTEETNALYYIAGYDQYENYIDDIDVEIVITNTAALMVSNSALVSSMTSNSGSSPSTVMIFGGPNGDSSSLLAMSSHQ